MAAIIVAGFLPPDWPDGARNVLTAIGAVLAVAGIAFAVWAARSLGRSLTPFPKPLGTGSSRAGRSRSSGIRSTRAASRSSPATRCSRAFRRSSSLRYSALLWVGKMRVEERLLAAAYDGYAAYCLRVRRRLIPFVY